MSAPHAMARNAQDKTTKRATIQDVADAAGVSIATVSRVVNGEGQVRSATRELVLAVIDSLRYRPTLSARQLGGARSKWIALVYQNPGIGFMHLVQSGAVDRCRNDGYMLSVHACQFTGSGLDRELLDIVDQLQPSGLILPPPMSVSPQVIETLGKCGIPFVRLCPQEDDHRSPRVWFDDRSAMQAMTRHVLDLGHRDIALITGLPATSPDPRRLGYLDAVREARLPAAERNISYGAYTFEGGLAAAQALLQRKRRPSAILAASDDMAAAVLHTAHAMGLHLPDELSVTGFDDSYVSTIVSPGLTTVHAPLHELGSAAADLLIKGPPDMQAGLVINRPWRLVQRGSTAAPASRT
ncbi:MAG: LacI family DNA-binding transcriptional regulator [Burkholderiales bacterium]|nr:LacI family DNA-binding transcriptional regulator [Burkholderiales bacterium]